MSRKLRNKPPRRARVNNNKVTLNTRQQFIDASKEWYNDSVATGWSGIYEFDASPWIPDILAFRKIIQEKGTHQVASVGDGERNPAIRNTHIWALEHPDVIVPIRAIYDHFNSKLYQYHQLDIQTPQMCVYYGNEKTRAGHGHYGWHKDTQIARGAYSRILSMSIALNDATEYKGGELQLLTGLTVDGKPKVKTADLSKAGKAVMFPSYIDHRVLPVTQGTRATCVTWLFGSYKKLDLTTSN